jgi:hypothetical protein
MPKYSCDNSPIINLVQKGLKHLEGQLKYDPTKRKQYKVLRDAFRIYKKDCAMCKGRANNDAKCLNAALNKLYRKLPFMHNSIYPWQNYEWDYGNFVDNNYSAKATGSTKNGSIRGLLRNTRIFFKLFNAMIFGANPNKRSRAGGTNKYSDFPIYGCQGNNRKNCYVWNRVKMSNLQRKPYNSKFFNKKTTGENSSSYFVRVGVCPRKDIKSSRKCINLGHKWIPDSLEPKKGKCFQDRYIYINNTPGYTVTTKDAARLMTGNPMAGFFVPKRDLFKLKGFIPSVKNDALSMTPGKLFKAYTGRDVKGYMQVQKCPKIVEKFKDIKGNHDFLKIVSITILIFSILVYLKLE